MKLHVIAGLSALTLSGAAGAESVQIVTRTILPQASAPSAGTMLEVKPGDVVLSAVPGWREAARLNEPIAMEAADRRINLAAGKILMRAAYQGEGSSGLPPRSKVFCGQRSFAMQRSSGVLGLAFAKISEARSDVVDDPTLCLADTNDDGRFDQVVSLRGGRSKPPLMGSIPETRYASQENVPAPGNSQLRIIYRGGGASGPLRFQLIYTNDGTEEEFKTLNVVDERGDLIRSPRDSYVKVEQLPQSIEIAGTKLTILSHDARTKVASIRIDRPFEQRAFGLTVTRVILLWF